MLKIISIFLLVLMQFSLSVALAAQIDEASEAKRHKLPMQRFMVYVEKAGDYSLDILVKRKYPYIENMSEEYSKLYREEKNKIQKLIEKMTGIIIVYDFSTREKVLEYKLPFSPENTKGFCCGQFCWGVGGEYWDGLTLSGGKVKSVGNYMIYSELYTSDKSYDEYVLTFIAAHGFK
ncbi:hypothetical protein [Scandinavium goeteborgense]|uniref:hypothetical protein n=1 Tax=Scandinavium goeteborgense TaxID=1851514 RepID=UPI000F66F45B|nr:hypothetical protein [Scandinavium goeteborgense]QKN83273.1 hypothetical protein A8O29_018990 [Scandinavium goeteborgense]